jgi:hypothetical protein
MHIVKRFILSRIPFYVLLPAILLVSAGCIIEYHDDDDDDADFTVTLVLKDEFDQEVSIFNQGEDITFQLAIRNNTFLTRTLFFRTAQQYDFLIKDLNGDDIWQWSAGRSFGGRTELEIEPGETITVTEDWDQHIDSPNPTPWGNIPAGDYRVTGWFLRDGDRATVNLEIR